MQHIRRIGFPEVPESCLSDLAYLNVRKICGHCENEEENGWLISVRGQVCEIGCMCDVTAEMSIITEMTTNHHLRFLYIDTAEHPL